MSDAETSRSLERGIQLLKALDQLDGATLSQLARAVDLPKTTVRRLLTTLVEQRLVRKSLADGLYRSAVLLPLETDYELPRHSWRLCDIAAPVMRRLTDQVRWPSDLFVRVGTGMRIVESSRSCSPISLYRGKLSTQVSMLLSAAARAYLAYCPDDERELLIARALEQSPEVMTEEGIRRMIEQTRRQGYGVRHPDYYGESRPDDGLRAIAVPVIFAGRVQACLNLLWVRDYLSESDFAARHLETLRAAAQEIAERCQAAP
ncbi:helix-turn-helix domain-containing protein [Marinobacterium aestuariivivens]|uniref:Helix-turn-helix domain-containing protein n=1 Tax=Marinobacterium aestuariivivens TaxID=1698799 RepID=A0ABW2A772_9GAMM